MVRGGGGHGRLCLLSRIPKKPMQQKNTLRGGGQVHQDESKRHWFSVSLSWHWRVASRGSSSPETQRTSREKALCKSSGRYEYHLILAIKGPCLTREEQRKKTGVDGSPFCSTMVLFEKRSLFPLGSCWFAENNDPCVERMGTLPLDEASNYP